MDKRVIAIKEQHLQKLADYRRTLYQKPELRNLFFEMTENCNEHCIHCGSFCGEERVSGELTKEDFFRILDEVKEDFSEKLPRLCITGGEPLLRPDFFEIMQYAKQLGFWWGMTSNGTLISKEIAKKLKEAGMQTISISIDGLEETHDAFRRTPGGYRRAMEGIRNLIEEGGFQNIQITTVLTHKSIDELDALFNIVQDLDIDSWRVINLEPMGRAKAHPELLMTPEDYRRMFSFIREHRMEGWPINYGCSHFLGAELEREVRGWYYLCNAGLYTASITSRGEILACLDIERRPELVQGNVLQDRFSKVWLQEFKQYRDEEYRRSGECKDCPQWEFCAGDSFHSWNFEEKRPEICFKGILF